MPAPTLARGTPRYPPHVAKRKRTRTARPDEDVFATLAPLSPLVADLIALRERQSQAVSHLWTLDPTVRGLDHARALLRAVRERATSDAIISLTARMSEDIRRAFFSLANDDPATANDISRDLMEIEVLLLDFARDINSLDRWTNLPTRKRSDAFKYGKVLDRLARGQGVPVPNVLPDAAEYQIHSSGLHPAPEGRLWDSLPDDLYTRMVLLSADLIEHVSRCVTALITLLNKHPDLAPPDTDNQGQLDLDILRDAGEAGREAFRPFLEAAQRVTGLSEPRGPFSRHESPEGLPARINRRPETEAAHTSERHGNDPNPSRT